MGFPERNLKADLCFWLIPFAGFAIPLTEKEAQAIDRDKKHLSRAIKAAQERISEP